MAALLTCRRSLLACGPCEGRLVIVAINQTQTGKTVKLWGVILYRRDGKMQL